jgi:hypothetical protein
MSLPRHIPQSLSLCPYTFNAPQSSITHLSSLFSCSYISSVLLSLNSLASPGSLTLLSSCFPLLIYPQILLSLNSLASPGSLTLLSSCFPCSYILTSCSSRIPFTPFILLSFAPISSALALPKFSCSSRLPHNSFILLSLLLYPQLLLSLNSLAPPGSLTLLSSCFPCS